MVTPMRKEVLRLYRDCMRSAHKCPEWEKREMMKTYVRMKFRDEIGTQDTTRVRRLISDAREELAQMEYYHSVYAEKQRQRAAPAEVTAVPSTPLVAPVFVNLNCPSCGSIYSPPGAKFCSACGLKRV